MSHWTLRVWNLFPARSPEWAPLKWQGMHFANRLGTSGGLDKNAEYVRCWQNLGAGFVEVGTVTPQPQGPNPGCILARDIANRALWNKMGFPNDGATAMRARLLALREESTTPVFVNIGKNRTTPNEKAVQDYLACMRTLRDVTDVFVVNISSPNTSGLRELLLPENLTRLLEPLVAEAKGSKTPLLLKLSPDMTDQQIREALDLSCQIGVDGWILTNTTLARTPTMTFPAEGGMSGAPLAARAKALLKLSVEHLGPRREGRLLISVGGVMTAEDVKERLLLGAHLVQLYSGLVFSGPGFFCDVAKQLKDLKL